MPLPQTSPLASPNASLDAPHPDGLAAAYLSSHQKSTENSAANSTRSEEPPVGIVARATSPCANATILSCRRCQGSSGGFARLIRSLCWRPSVSERERAADLEDATSIQEEQRREHCDQSPYRGRCPRGRAEREPEVVGTAGELVQVFAWQYDDAGDEIWGDFQMAAHEPIETVPREREPEDAATPLTCKSSLGASLSACSSIKVDSPVRPSNFPRAAAASACSPLTRVAPSVGSTSKSLTGISPGRFIEECDSRPIADLLLQVAQERDFQSIRVGNVNKRLLDMLMEAFALLGISSVEELEEQLLSDSRNHEHAWIGTRDAIVSMVRSTLVEAGAQQDEIGPVLAAASSLLSKALRRFSMQKGSPDREGLFIASFGSRGFQRLGDVLGQSDPASPGVLPSRGAPVCCVGGDAFGLISACEAVDPFRDDEEEDHPDLEEAIRTIDRVAAEVSKIMAEAHTAPRNQVSALLERKWVLENLPEYVRAKNILADGFPTNHCETPKPTVIRVRREDQVLLRL